MVLTAVGADRPGLVERISTLIHDAGGNLEDSRMAILGGEFALILLMSGVAESLEQVGEASDRLASELGLSLSLKPTQRRSSSAEFMAYQLKVTGMDHAGIVAQVSALLSERKVNVAALDSRVEYAPHSGTPIFHLAAQLQLPSTMALSGFRSALSSLCERENLDFVLETASL